MILDGDINLKIPGLHDKLTALIEGREKKIYQRLKEHGGEFDIALAESAKENIDFDIWVRMDESDVSIKTDYEDEDLIDDALFLKIESCGGGVLCLTLSVDQARAIKEILEHHINIWESLRWLKKEKQILARTNKT